MSKSRIGRFRGSDRKSGPASRVVAAYVSGNALPAGHLAALVASVHAAMDTLRRPPARGGSTGRATRTGGTAMDHAGWGGTGPVGRR